MTVSAVNFGTIPATSFTVDSATQITAVSPAGTGTVNVRVTTLQGQSAAAGANQFTYIAPAGPTISNLNPNTGPAAGGTAVTITGTNLAGATSVMFGANAATITSNTATQIVATSPAGTAGAGVNVTVTTPNGTSGALSFTYQAAPVPTVTSVNPNSGDSAGGTNVVITGTNLTGATAVAFGANAATSFNVDSATQITAVAPSGTGTVNVRVTTSHGTSATAAGNQFTYAAPLMPSITGLNPNMGEPAGGTSVVIAGTNLNGATAVTFGGVAAASFTVNSATQITAVSPAGIGTVDVVVTTPSGSSATGMGVPQFTYVEPAGSEAVALFQAFPPGSFPPPAPEGTLWFGPTGQVGFYIYIASGFDQWQII